MGSDYSFKVSIVGCGNVGATTAYCLMLKGIASHLTLIDIQKSRAQGLVLDLEHCLAFTPNASFTASDDFGACADSRLIIITAGKKQAEGETRLELANANRKILRGIFPKILEAAPDAIFLIVSNPVDVLTCEVVKNFGLPREKVFGSGTILDTARFQFYISEAIKVHPRSIDAYILGEHGDSSFPVWSSANILGKPLLEFPGFTKETAQRCYNSARDAAHNIINDLGYTCYSIATATAEITQCIKDDSHQVFPLSVLLKDYYGHNDVALSVPCVLGRNGIERIIEIPLNTREKKALAKSVGVLKTYGK